MVIWIDLRIFEKDSFDLQFLAQRAETLNVIMYQTASLAKLPLGGFIFMNAAL